MRRWVVGVALGVVLCAPFRPGMAQNSTGELLDQAHRLYEQVDLERALGLLRQVVSPGWPFEVTAPQRVDAYKYLGATLALRGQSDSAVLYFRAALERDAFTDLDPATFTPAQIALFAQARRLTFAVAARPVTAARFDPRSEHVSFTVVTTHAATLQVLLRATGAPAEVVLFAGPSDGLRELDWNGLLGDGRLAPPGRYELLAVGQSTLRPVRDTARVYLDVAHEREALEDTLPEIGSGSLLPEEVSPSAARGDLLKGVGVAAAAVLIADRVSSPELGRGLPAASRVVAVGGGVAGVVAYLYRQSHRELPQNVAENARRRTARVQTNATIVHRNEERIARTVLVITPAAGVGP